ncbi:MAG: phosphoglycerate kinase [bacterium]|nr:phosphoglycerate kinase [bacterium]
MHLLKDGDVKGMTVFLRADLDVPALNGTIEDDTRLLSAIPTIEYILKNNAKVVIAGHLGRPTGLNYESRIKNQELSLKPVAEWFAKKLSHDSLFTIHDSILGGFDGWAIGANIFLLENLRFNSGEEANDPEFAKSLASLAEIYVNDAFAMTHRNHASIVGITKFLPHFAGFHLEQEVSNLSEVIENPKRPLVVIVGGKKLETKLPLVEKMHRIADYVLVGGKIAQETVILMKVQHERVPAHGGIIIVADSNEEKSDITPTDAENFIQIINKAKTIIWNGSMGIIENEKSSGGTRVIAEAILKSGAYSVVGGGDTVEFLNKLGIINKFSFVSTGGGAMLSFLSGEKLPGLVALEKN